MVLRGLKRILRKIMCFQGWRINGFTNFVARAALVTLTTCVFVILFISGASNGVNLPPTEYKVAHLRANVSRITTTSPVSENRHVMLVDMFDDNRTFKSEKNIVTSLTKLFKGDTELLSYITNYTQIGRLKHEHFFNVDRRVKPVRCADIFKKDKSALQQANSITATYKKKQLRPFHYINMTKDCPSFIRSRGYITESLTDFEKHFPLAFSIVMYKDVEQTERLLRAIYRPEHFYCIHVDKNSKKQTYNAIKALSKCFDNVFLASNRSAVEWGTWSVLQSDLTCMEDLLRQNKTWKYFINLTGQEFPLRTNYELVKLLQGYNGANLMQGGAHGVDYGYRSKRWEKAGSPPHNATVMIASVHTAVNRGFVEFIFNDKKAKDLLKWTKYIRVPDETFFATLNFNAHLGAPGAYTGTSGQPSTVRYKNWGEHPFYEECHGKRVRRLCIFGNGDLPVLANRHEMFVNKMFLDYNPFVLDCLEELHFNRTRDEYVGKSTLDVRRYVNLDIVKNHVKLPSIV